MSSTPWKSDKWFVSPWNFAEEIRKDLNFSQNIKIHDVTLRDGEQQAGIAMTKDQKIAIAEKLAEIGVHRIEAGMPAVSKQDADAIKDIVKRNLGPDIFAFARCMKEDVKKAVDCGVKGIVVEIPSSEHVIKHAYGWPLEKAIQLSIEATRYAHENGLYTVFFPIDATRAEIGWFLDLIERVATEGYMDALVMVDTFGGISPHAVPYMYRKVKERIKDKPIEVHFHDDFLMGSANTLMALASGVEVAHTTVLGVGERAGNAPYESLVLSLLTMYGVDLGIKYDKIYELARLFLDFTKMPIRPNQPITGETLYNIESGIVTAWFKRCAEEAPLEIVPMLETLMGQHSPRVVLGKHSGLPSVEIWLDKIGASTNDEQKDEILLKIKELSMLKGGLLTEDEFRNIVSKVVK